MGYAGGTSKTPTYHNIGDHAETIQIDYDPAKISYAELLDIFWAGHNPASHPVSSQYRPIVFYHNDEQEQLALESKEREETRLGRKVFAEIEQASDFHLAEPYHQKYYLRLIHKIEREFREMYPEYEDFLNSTAVARVNGHLGGNGTPEKLRSEIASYGLSPLAERLLTDLAY